MVGSAVGGRRLTTVGAGAFHAHGRRRLLEDVRLLLKMELSSYRAAEFESEVGESVGYLE